MPRAGAARGGALTGFAKWRECMSGDRAWEKEILLDSLHWIRQAIAIVMGVVAGVAGLTGAIPFILFFTCAIAAGVVFYRSLRIDEEDFGGHQLLSQEGVAPAFSLFLVVWVCIYSTLHA